MHIPAAISSIDSVHEIGRDSDFVTRSFSFCGRREDVAFWAYLQRDISDDRQHRIEASGAMPRRFAAEVV